ncbi:nucleotidyltransferase domain-containing protein [Candidatus Woesearchaeota archaeon]|nr:nucleotidyltransferase domain-containing protein [Candidatus Woesearchaeota archaeon]HLC80673.1 nucleotidyltransferase domain-containing protein [Candidatus Nanoarchaeia archaeon]
MVAITKNEAKVVNFLLRNFSRDYNINQLAKEVKLSPRGAFKILKKLESNSILNSQKIGNNLIYKINFENDVSLDVCQFVLTEKETTPYIQTWINDLQSLREITKMAVLFGSILTKEKQANDVDILLVFPKENLPKVQEQIKKINQIKSKKLHAIIQTKENLFNNIQKKDSVLLEEIRTGMILWGRNIIVEAIKHGED